MIEYIENHESLTALGISIVALVISIIALYYTIQAFLLKSGHKLRCDIIPCSNIQCSDKYIASITLENLKDRATVIFDIYLKLGRGQYLLIESFQGKPLVLKPFEVYYKEFEPLFFYTEGTKIVKTRNFLFDKKLSTKILLSTTDGKYVVNSNLKRWNPITDFFKNYFTAIIQPVRVPYKGKSYGDKTKYLVELKYSSGSNQVIDIYEGDDRLMKFKNFSLTRESLKSSKS